MSITTSQLPTNDQIIFYDIPTNTTPPKAWSLNPWKTRLVLNYKSLPYQTQWLEYPELAPTLSSYGVSPNPEAVNPLAKYSTPALRLPSGEYVMDSLAIAKALEEIHPNPPLTPEDPVVAKTQSAVDKVRAALSPIWQPRVPALLNPASSAYFSETRSKRCGMPLSVLANSEKGGEAAWEAAVEGFRELSALFSGEREGPFVLGETVSYADFVLGGFWRFVEILSEEGDVIGRALGEGERFERHFEAVRGWMGRDD